MHWPFSAGKTGNGLDQRQQQAKHAQPEKIPDPDQAKIQIAIGSTAPSASCKDTDKKDAGREFMKINPAKTGKAELLGDGYKR